MPSSPAGTGRQGLAGLGDRASGKVVSVTAGLIVVQETNRATKALTTVRVSVDAATTYTETVPARASALKIGLCVSATGTADTTGAVTARTIALSAATASGCSEGLRGGFPGNRARAGNGSGPVTTSG